MGNSGISLKSVTAPLTWLESERGIKREEKAKGNAKGKGKVKVKEGGVHKI